ncbi:MAG: hypothetical protein ACK5LT_00590 [Lachnospirales bacterium]
MKNNFFVLIIILLSLTSCNSKVKTLKEDIKSLEKEKEYLTTQRDTLNATYADKQGVNIVVDDIVTTTDNIEIHITYTNTSDKPINGFYYNLLFSNDTLGVASFDEELITIVEATETNTTILSIGLDDSSTANILESPETVFSFQVYEIY